MAKYKAIYEGRLPHAIYQKISQRDITCPQGLSRYLLENISKVYKKCINFCQKQDK